MNREELILDTYRESLNLNVNAAILYVKATLGLRNPQHVIDALSGFGVISQQTADQLGAAIHSEIQTYVENTTPEERASDLETISNVLNDLNDPNSELSIQLEDASQDVQRINELRESLTVFGALVNRRGLVNPLSILGRAISSDIDDILVQEGLALNLKSQFFSQRDQIEILLAENGEPPLTELENAILSVLHGNPGAADNIEISYFIDRIIEDTVDLFEGGLGEAVEYAADIYESINTPGQGPDLDQIQNDPNYDPSMDLDGDGVHDSEDDDIDGDGILNEEDDDIDGDGARNLIDAKPYGDNLNVDGTPIEDEEGEEEEEENSKESEED